MLSNLALEFLRRSTYKFLMCSFTIFIILHTHSAEAMLARMHFAPPNLAKETFSRFISNKLICSKSPVIAAAILDSFQENKHILDKIIYVSNSTKTRSRKLWLEGNDHGNVVASIAMDSTPENVKYIPVECSDIPRWPDIRDLERAIHKGARVVNISMHLNNELAGQGWRERRLYGYLSKNPEQRILYNFMLRHQETLFIVSAGNDSAYVGALVEKRNIPAIFGTRLPNVMSVAATVKSAYAENDFDLAYYSNYGRCVLIGANGSHTQKSTSRFSLKYWFPQFYTVTGTSVAAPIVTNVVLKMLAINPQLSPEMIISILSNTVARAPKLKGRVISGGCLNEEAALAAAKEFPSPVGNGYETE